MSMIKRFIKWTLLRISTPFCQKHEVCVTCPFGDKDCNCSVNEIINSLERCGKQ